MTLRQDERKGRGMATIGLGIIGAGIMGERLARAAAEFARDSVRLTGVWDPSPAAMARLGGLAPAAASAAALIDGADCVYIASPPGSHLAHAGAALDAGKAAFAEKPLATSVAEAAGFVAARKGARMAVNFPMATSMAVARLRGWIDAGAVGTPERLEIAVDFANWPRGWQQRAAGWLDRREEGGFTREVVSHFLFLTGRVLGAMSLLESAVAWPEDGRSERSVVASLTAGGVPVSLRGGVGTTARDDQNSWTLTGSAGRVRLRDWAFAEREVDGAWVGDPDAPPQDRARPLVLQRQLAGVAAMTRGAAHPLATMDEAFAVQRIVEGVLAG